MSVGEGRESGREGECERVRERAWAEGEGRERAGEREGVDDDSLKRQEDPLDRYEDRQERQEDRFEREEDRLERQEDRFER